MESQTQEPAPNNSLHQENQTTMPAASQGQDSPIQTSDMQPTLSTQLTPVSANNKKKIPKNTLIAIVVIFIVVVLTAYGAYAYVNSLPNSLLQSALSNAFNQKSFAAKFTLINGTNSTTPLIGDIAATGGEGSTKNGELVLGIGSGDQRVSINALAINGSLFLKATNAEGLQSITSSLAGPSDSAFDSPEVVSLLKNLDNQWFELSSSDIRSLAQSNGSNEVTGVVSANDIKQVEQIYAQHPFIVVDKTYNDENIDSTTTAHFSLTIDRVTEVSFLQAIKNANLSTLKVTDADINSVKTTSQTQGSALDVWIARDSRTFKQIRITDPKQGEQANLTLTLNSQLPHFDSLTAPANVKPFSDILSVLLGADLSAARTSQLQ